MDDAGRKVSPIFQCVTGEFDYDIYMANGCKKKYISDILQTKHIAVAIKEHMHSLTHL